MIINPYQTIPKPDGTIIQGMFPTIDWYKAITNFISFENKTIVDYGCCHFSYGIQALKDGASKVDGWDLEQARVDESKSIINLWNVGNKALALLGDIDCLSNQKEDIAIFSMIIHWMKTPLLTIPRLSTDIINPVFIYRYPQNKSEPGYRPTLEELNSLLFNSHSLIGFTKLSNTEEQNIMLAVYVRNF